MGYFCGIHELFLENIDETYRQFASKLLPEDTNLLGIRLPILKKIAQEIANNDWQSFLRKENDLYFEDFMLKGFVIGKIRGNIEVILPYIQEFVPKINNWSLCDSFCASLKITNKNKKVMWDFIQPYFLSSQEYEIRFAVVMALDFFLEDEYIEKVLQRLDSIKHEGYYVKMAVAWALSVCYIKHKNHTEEFLGKNRLDDFTFNKALQKMIESRCVNACDKERLKILKRKKNTNY